MAELVEYIKDQIWILEYPIRYFGIDLYGRMTILKLDNGDLIIHDPCRINDTTKQEIDAIGTVKYIIAPGSYHHLFVTDMQECYPGAETFLCPGLERKRPDIRFEWILGNKPDPRWQDIIEQVVVQGPKYMWEVAFFHKPSKTLLLVDLLENIGDNYKHPAGLALRFWWKIFRMWNRPKAAPEYQLGWGNRAVLRNCLEKIVAWHAQRIILSHGELVEKDISDTLTGAWKSVLNP